MEIAERTKVEKRPLMIKNTKVEHNKCKKKVSGANR